MEGTSRRTLGSQAQHIIWKTIHGPSKRTPPSILNNTITFKNKITITPKHIANCFAKQFTNIVKHTKQTEPLTETTQNIQGYNITFTATIAISICKAVRVKTRWGHTSSPVSVTVCVSRCACHYNV